MIEIALGLMGGLGLFLFGMKQMSDGLEKASAQRNFSRNIFYSNHTVFQRGHCVSCQFCKFRTDEPVSGGRRNYGGKYWYHSHFSVNCL